jgi:subtilisin family serine protease
VRGLTILVLGIFALSIIAFSSFSAFAQDSPFTIQNQFTPNSEKFVPGQLIVGLKNSDPNFNDKVSNLGGQLITSIPQIKAHVVKVPINNEETFIQAISKNPNVEYVEHDGIVQALSIPNDPYYSFQWGTQRIGMETVWSPSFNEGSGILIAVVDEGVYWDHPDLENSNIRKDIDRDFVDNDFDTRPTSVCAGFNGLTPEYHGTMVSGVIAGTINNTIGISGVGNFDILPVRVLNACGSGTYSQVAQGIIYAADMGADVINLSLGSPYWQTSTLENAVIYASAYPSESVVVAASGNDGNSVVSYPAGFSKVISTGATTIYDTITSYSQYGSTLDLSAPGGDEGSCDSQNPPISYILTTSLDSQENFGYYCVAGTSFAAPLVSAVAGLVKSANPCATDEDIKAHLEQTADDLGAAGWDPYFGNGLVRADVALASPVNLSFPCESSDNVPVITLNGANPQIIEAPNNYVELYATAFDTEDGNLTSSIQIDSSSVDTAEPATYDVTYDVTDSDGNSAHKTRQVVVQDTTPPQITLIGDDPQVIEISNPYSEWYATAYDSLDGDLTGSIVIDSSSVNTNVVGTYGVTYDVSDAAGNVAQATRQVIVQDSSSGGTPTIHVGDLNWVATDKKNWNVKLTITIHDDGHLPVSGVLVQGTFTGNTLSPVNCTTDDTGTCQVNQTTKLDELIFSVVGISATDYAASNAHHDPDGDFPDGDPTVTILKGSISKGSNGSGDGGTGTSCPPNSNKPSCR